MNENKKNSSYSSSYDYLSMPEHQNLKEKHENQQPQIKTSQHPPTPEIPQKLY